MALCEMRMTTKKIEKVFRITLMEFRGSVYAIAHCIIEDSID